VIERYERQSQRTDRASGTKVGDIAAGKIRPREDLAAARWWRGSILRDRRFLRAWMSILALE
jgi:hypothetical protein